MFERLTQDEVPWSLGLNVSPTLLAMLEAVGFPERCGRYLDRLIEVAVELEAELSATSLAPALASHRDFLKTGHASFHRRKGRLVPAIRRFAEAGHIELLASAATHPVLPLIADRPECVRAQVVAGIEAYRRSFGERVRGFWLPECGYVPEIEPALAGAGIAYAIVDAHGILDADPRPTGGTARPILSPGGVAFFGRDTATARRVWSAAEGYPGDARYREFHSDLGYDMPFNRRQRHGLGGFSGPLGLKLRRVTGNVSVEEKEPYDRSAALEAVTEHARDFVGGLTSALGALPNGAPPAPIIVSAYDAELFGHWWFEGPQFLEAVFRRLASEKGVVIRTPSEALAESPLCEIALPGSSSWGRGGYFEVWLTEAAMDMPPRLRDAAERLIGLARRHPGGAASKRGLDQAARELMLAQASDWPFMLAMGTTVSYARSRFESHLERFHELCDTVERGAPDGRLIAQRFSEFPVFPFLDHRVYT